MDLQDDYTRAGFGGRLGFGERSALVVVDVCRAYLEPSSPLYAGVEDAAASVGRLVAGARAAGVPVLWTRVRFDPAGRSGVPPQGAVAGGLRHRAGRLPRRGGAGRR